MNRFAPFLLLSAVLLLGCGVPSAHENSQPLTVAEWQTMPKETKFADGTMERLKLGDPKFQQDDQWDRFARTVYLPARQRELAEKKKTSK